MAFDSIIWTNLGPTWLHERKTTSTVGIHKPDVSGFRMVDIRSVPKWSCFLLGKLKGSHLVLPFKSDLQKVWISNDSGFRMVRFWIPTVLC